MANLLNDIAAFLKTKADHKEPYYTDTLLDESNKGIAVAVYEYAGGSSIPQIGSVHRSVQIVTRSDKAALGRATAMQLYKALESEDGFIQFTPSRWGMVSLRQPPFKFKVDDKGRHLFAFNLGITTDLQ